ncbi:MAG: helix-turn-helix domain-containing protein [Lachnospiraceae bacterium]|nr:helix-turn-helix domain-containing protein [Lachnospiraceae bacterium]
MKQTSDKDYIVLTCENTSIRCEFILKKEFITGVTASQTYHFHSIYEMHIPVTGILHMMVEDKDIMLLPGEVCIIPPDRKHYVYADKSSYRIGFRFTFFIQKKSTEPSDSLFQYSYGKLTDVFVVKNCPIYEKYLKAAADNFACAMPHFMTSNLLFLSLYETALAMITVNCVSMSNDHKTLSENEPPIIYSDTYISECIESFISRHYTEKIRLDDMATQLNLSVRQTERVTSRLFGMSFTSLVNKRRLTVAKLLLRTTDIPIEHIAIASGFENINYFYRKFSAECSMTPKEYRNLHVK